MQTYLNRAMRTEKVTEFCVEHQRVFHKGQYCFECRLKQGPKVVTVIREGATRWPEGAEL
jgi:hypothetical protein